jgi:hypothetical protein
MDCFLYRPLTKATIKTISTTITAVRHGQGGERDTRQLRMSCTGYLEHFDHMGVLVVNKPGTSPCHSWPCVPPLAAASRGVSEEKASHEPGTGAPPHKELPAAGYSLGERLGETLIDSRLCSVIQSQSPNRGLDCQNVRRQSKRGNNTTSTSATCALRRCHI